MLGPSIALRKEKKRKKKKKNESVIKESPV